MKKKIFLAIGAFVASNISGCAVVGSMVTTNDEYVQIAANNIGVNADTLSLKQETLHPSLNYVTYELKSKDGKRYKCQVNTSVRGSSDEALCQVRTTEGKWEYVGKSVELSKKIKEEEAERKENGESSESKSFFTVGDPRYSLEREHTRDAEMHNPASKAKVKAAQPAVSSSDPTYVGGTENTAVPTLSSDNTVNNVPTKTRNGLFKVRDEQGHSYECHFANVGEVKSETLSVCTKLY
ncbi:MAG: hypothetical protein J6Z28_02070 [Succinivibrio sp.]|nr:hypothetical protein [Succinivibrio sp.]